ncbi:hypothetical protein [Nocardia sp. NBC_01009]|uniref:hypothetical protein n=1 Tax=Nocardia sp. NBC_01009 TaxID=2975996 RepID=UPI00386B214F|nr:hypothetical protein OHA42_17855 [Nocardia sp. NBC_01009]
MTMVVAAIAAGAAAGVNETTKRLVADAFQVVKKLISGRYQSADVAVVEHDPSSGARRAVLAQELSKAGAGEDEELLAAARRLLVVVHQHVPQVEQIVGVWLQEVRAGELEITDIASTGSGVIGTDVAVGGAMKISGVRAGGQEPPHPPQARP